jgi:tetratricopeptide (TPR) repeat protein
LPCLKCGGKSEDDALLCDACADSSFKEPKFFLNPVLIGTSVYSRLRDCGSAAVLLGPNADSDIIPVESSNLLKAVKDVNVRVMPHEELKGLYERCNAILAHLGVPIRLDSPQMLLTEDAAETITAIVQKINLTETMYPKEAVSDLYIRLGVVYWSASNGILMRAAGKKWREEKRAYLVTKAKEFFSKVDPGDDLHAIAARTMGLMCLDAEEWTEAEEHLAVAVRSFQDDLTIGEGLSRAHLMLGNPMEALSRIDEVINQSERPEFWVLKGKILRDLDRANEALECLSRAISLDSRYLPGHDMMIETLRDLGRIEESAMAESQRALSRRPDLERKLGELISEFKKVSVAEKVAASATPSRARPEVAKPAPEPPPKKDPIDMAKDALDSKDYDLAIQRVNHILKEKPDTRAATLILIEALTSKGELDEASAKVHLFYDRNREDASAWYWRGIIAHKQGKWGASVQYLSKCVSLNPKMIDGWNAMGEILLSHGKQTGADESFSKALELDPENPRAWLGKAKTMAGMGRWGAAIQSMDKYNSLVPSDKEVWMLKADLLFEKEKYKRAIEAYDKFLELTQDDSHVLGRKGIALNAIGMVSEARRCLEESVRLDPDNKEASKWLKALAGGGT